LILDFKRKIIWITPYLFYIIPKSAYAANDVWITGQDRAAANDVWITGQDKAFNFPAGLNG
jgi:hypothetical protein